MYEQSFRNIDNTLWNDDGCSSELDYIEQTSWVLFLKYLDDYEAGKERAAEIDGGTYKRIIDGEFRWSKWAAPKRNGKIDHNSALTGIDLLDFVNKQLFPHLKGFMDVTDDSGSITYKVGEIFSELENKMLSGYSLRDVINIVDDLEFLSNKNKHELSSLYEDKINNMGNAGRNGGQYYTPRPLIRAIVRLINPKIGETVYDGAVGSAGFLCEAYDWMKNKQAGVREFEKLQNETFYGIEKKKLAYLIGQMNMILHGIEAPNILRKNSLTSNISDIQDRDRVDVILTNPPFGGKERKEIQQNFPIRTSETANLFMQHFIKKLKKGGRCGMVIKNTFLSNTDNASIAIRKQLLEDCNLHTVLDLPSGTFLGTGVKTVVLFFTKGEPTKKIWYYQLDVGRTMGKNNPLNDNDLAEFTNFAESQKESSKSWYLNVKDINKETWELTVNNPNNAEDNDGRTPVDIIQTIGKLNTEVTTEISRIKELL